MPVLSELRVMASAQFNSQPLLCVVLDGDARLLDKLRREELIPLGSRIRTRLSTEAATPEQLRQCLDFVLAACGNANLMTATLKHTLCDHAVGNYRVLTTLAGELLSAAAELDLPQLDEQLYFKVFEPPVAMPKRAGTAR